MGQNAERAIRKVLLVEDDALVRKTMRAVLERAGYTVAIAESVEAAESALTEEIDLVVTDVNLPDGSGVGVAEAAARRHPAPPVIAMSGNAQQSDVLALGRVGVRTLLNKPFRPKALLEAIDQLAPPSFVELDAVVRRMVGEHPMQEVVAAVRRGMVQEALALTAGNKAQAASLLGISRQNLQNILTRNPS